MTRQEKRERKLEILRLIQEGSPSFLPQHFLGYPIPQIQDILKNDPGLWEDFQQDSRGWTCGLLETDDETVGVIYDHDFLNWLLDLPNPD